MSLSLKKKTTHLGMSENKIFKKFIDSHVHTLFGSFLPTSPLPRPTLSPLPTLLPGRTCSALINNFVEEKT
jgi:hypothetical protein